MRNVSLAVMCRPRVLGHAVSNPGTPSPHARPLYPAGPLSLAIGGALAHLGRSVVFVTLLVGLGLAGVGLTAAAL